MYAVVMLLCVGSADGAVSQVPGSAALLEDLGAPVGARGKPPVTTRVVITPPAGAAKRQEAPTHTEVKPASAFAPRPRPEQGVTAFALPTPLPPPTLPVAPSPAASLPPPPTPTPTAAAMPTPASAFRAQMVGGPPSQPAMPQAQQQSSFVEFIQGAMQSPAAAATAQPTRPQMNGGGLRSLYKSLQ